ncbi:hypothetical protein GGS20DRAFT_543874 [Poronia punctata]|nr:hypothetical protein GGS20DRAFT_543874 [Poronia punctata]
MAPKRQQQQARNRPSPMDVIPRVERLKEDRDNERERVFQEYDEYMETKTEELRKHYASLAKERSSKAKDLLNNYIKAIRERQEIEEEIAKIVAEARAGLTDLATILEAAYVGRQQQAHDGVRLFSSLTSDGNDKPSTTAGKGRDQSYGGKDMARGKKEDGEKAQWGFSLSQLSW